MHADIRKLKPRSLWSNFCDINAIPRASKKERKITDFMASFGVSRGLFTQVDPCGNVIIKKPASREMEKHKPVILQSHLDIVHQKNEDRDFDFDKQGIEMFIDGDWVKAKETTLGADNGIGVASIMAILQSDEIKHPRIEALFTVDEETGMTGAKGLQPDLLEGKFLLNLDTEDDRELTVGCAGGIDMNAYGNYTEEKTHSEILSYKVKLSGLTGGHSGMDIHLGRGNANKLMNRFLLNAFATFKIHINRLSGGGLRNAIPRESTAIIGIHKKHEKEFVIYFADQQSLFRSEYQATDPNLKLEYQKVQDCELWMDQDVQAMLLGAIYASHNGIYRMSPEINGLVQTSANLAKVHAEKGQYKVNWLIRSSVETEKSDLGQSIKSAFDLIGANIEFSGSYPGWKPTPDSEIVKILKQTYQDLYNEQPIVNACHAGLECGIIGKIYPGLDMVSFGPNIRGAHSPDEKVQISSVNKFWNLLLETLTRIPANYT